MTTGYYCAIFPFCGGGKKKKKDKKTKAFYDWATTGIPVIKKPMLLKLGACLFSVFISFFFFFHGLIDDPRAS